MDNVQEKRRGALDFTGVKNRTHQSFKAEADINNIVAKYVKTNHIDYFASGEASYGFAPAYTYLEAMQQLEAARDAFMDIPAPIRARFDHDPIQFLAFVENPASRPELAALGLLKVDPTPTPTPAPQSDPGASAPPNVPVD